MEAVFWYKKAAEQEDPNALLRLGFCYKNGTGNLLDKNFGVVKDLQVARDYFCKAIEVGEIKGFLEEKDKATAHRGLAEVLYAQNVRDNFSVGTLDIANCIPGINLISFPISGALSIAEKNSLRDFMTTEDGRMMMYHCKTAAELGDIYAEKMLNKLRKAL